MRNKQKRTNFWLRWVLATCLAFGVSLIWLEVGERPDIDPLHAVTGAVVIGCAQSFVLKQHINHFWWWILACVLSWGCLTAMGVGAIGWVTPRTELLGIRFIYGGIFGAIAGVCLGLGQWLLVLRTQIPTSGRWIRISTICWALALALGWTVGGFVRLMTNLFLGEVIGLAVTWLVVACITGIDLLELLKEAKGE